jgi:Mn2+/Fe2+ NRAMP family transporter
LSVSIALAAAVALAGVSVLSMLVAASVIGGFGTPIGLVLLVRLARDPEVMADHPISRRLAAAGWAVTVLVGGLGLLLVLGAALGTL